MKKFQKFSELSKGNRAFRIVNDILAVAMIAICVVMLVIFGKKGDPNNRLLVTIAVLVVTIIPYIIEQIMRRRFSNVFLFGFLSYMVVAGIIGSVFNVYYTEFWYDRFVHTLMGFIFAMVGLIIVSKLTDYKKLSVSAVIFFVFTFSLAVECVWELFEWFTDLYLGQTAQGGAFPGDIPLVTDTMEDILCNFSGAILFCIYFVIGKFSKVSLGIKSIELQLAGGQCERKFFKKKETIEMQSEEKKEDNESVEEIKENDVMLENIDNKLINEDKLKKEKSQKQEKSTEEKPKNHQTIKNIKQ